MEETKTSAYNVWFVSDLHISHANILKHSPKRIEVMGITEGNDIMIQHDNWIVDMWLSTTKRGDHIYVLGDFIMSKRDRAVYILHRLKSNGCKIHLIVGNHDKSTEKLTNLFNSIDLLKVVDFKKSAFPFLDKDFTCVLCHYPMKTWPRKCYGAVNLYGHVHDNSPWIDNENYDLCLNVSFDAPFANYGLISLERVYEWYKKELNGMTPEEYIDYATKNDAFFVR